MLKCEMPPSWLTEMAAVCLHLSSLPTPSLNHFHPITFPSNQINPSSGPESEFRTVHAEKSFANESQSGAKVSNGNGT